MAQLPVLVNSLFISATIFCIWQFFLAARRSIKFLAVILVLLVLEGILSIKGFYAADGFPPRFLFAILPILVALIVGLFIIKDPRQFNTRHLLLLNAVRIPVEICLAYAYHGGLAPREMTFEGFNFDILSGISSLVLYYLVYTRKTAGTRTLLVWNVAALLLLINVLGIAVLSAPTPFQQIAFEQPNRLVALFPFIWLPGIVVPLVLISHIISIRQLTGKK